MEINVRVEGLDGKKTSERILNHKAKMFTASTIARYMNPYVPMRTGALSQTYEISDTNYSITYTQPYAHRMYYGDGFNFNKEQHPQAQSRWAEPVKANYKPVIAHEVTTYIKRG